ncbi:hypothetical protein DVH24_011369 [Malus domestica]|uniref:non-specific serine/threonine protein kinase n=1 Tax=Malus domestica TaxID=3750 RepID=A0A498JZ93_MALDO|nr:hypothetical protein DVH24_011369 [Malus domestica]
MTVIHGVEGRRPGFGRLWQQSSMECEVKWQQVKIFRSCYSAMLLYSQCLSALSLSNPRNRWALLQMMKVKGTLADDEVEALREIAVQLNKKDWNFSDPCSNIPTVSIPHTDQYNNTLVCNCSFSGNVCHIQSIFLTGQDLDGVLPPALSKLPYLKQGSQCEQLIRTYSWLFGKHNYSPSTLVWCTNLFDLDTNLTRLCFQGLGEQLIFWNYSPGVGQFVYMLIDNGLVFFFVWVLGNYSYLRANNLTGELPLALIKMTKLRVLEMQASGLEGPLPSSLSALNNMTYLRISDLSGESSAFPNLSNMTSMVKFITCVDENYFSNIGCLNCRMLRSCNITGEIPEYISTMRNLTDLDLSFNRLEGSIPDLENIIQLSTIYLTRNLLTGLPAWIKNRGSSLILSKCLLPCSKDRYSLHLNCGGNQTTVGNIKYEADDAPGGAAKSYYGVGRRIFNVYIQEKLVLEDFDIEKKAQGVDKEAVEVFTAVVSVKTLEIRFQWAGKGTTNVPTRGIYGSLISAISVQSDFKPPSERKKFIVIGVVSALFLLFVILGILWLKGCFRGRTTREQDLMGLDLQTGFFKFKQLKAATNNFDAANKLGEGGFGVVYKGELLDGTFIAVKQLSSKSKQGNREFVNEIGMISALQHPNLVKLYGCCIEGNQLFLVYEYMENNSLSHFLLSLSHTL